MGNNNNAIDGYTNYSSANNSYGNNNSPNTNYETPNAYHNEGRTYNFNPRTNYLQYDTATNRLKNLNNMKHKIRLALGNIGIYLPINVGMKEVLFCVYVYYMFNLFGDNNSKWKEKYFPLDGMELYNFIENKMNADPTANKKYIDIANEIEAITYPDRSGQSNVILNRGLIEEFIDYGRNTDTKNKIGEISNNTVNTDNVLTSTQELLNKLLSMWKWKKHIVYSTRRKRKEDKQTPVIEENALLDDILLELSKEPQFSLPNLKIDRIKLTNKDLNITSNSNYTSMKYPYTIYNSLSDNYSDSSMSVEMKKLFAPYNWSYNSELNIDNIRPNTILSLHYKLKNNRNPYGYSTPDPNDEFPTYENSGSFSNSSWDNITKNKINLTDIKLGNPINIGYKDKYNGIYSKNNTTTSAYSYLGWKPEIFLYSKSVPKESTNTIPEGGTMSKTSATDSTMDHMNVLDNADYGNLGLTILVPSVVEKFMKETVPSLSSLRDTEARGYNPYEETFSYWSELQNINRIRGIETVFLVGIYPVDQDNNIIYKDPIVFQFFSGEQLNDDLGLSFADYRKIKSPTTKNKVLLRSYYNLKLGQMFYRNNYSRVSTEKKIFDVVTSLDNGKEVLQGIVYENTKVGDVSKNLLYLYGRDAYMPYVGKTPLSSGQNHNVTNPDDNTYIANIKLPDNVEYVFKKYGNTKIAVQLYMATTNDTQMSGLEYFKTIKKANGGIIEDQYLESSEILAKIPGTYIGLPYRTESKWEMGVNTTRQLAYPYGNLDIIDAKVVCPDWSLNNDSYMSLENSAKGLSFTTEPVIIDCNKSDEYNAPWLDKRNAPYVSKVVTEEFDYYTDKLVDNKNYKVMKKGIYIKIPNGLSLYMLNDESVKKYEQRKRQVYDTNIIMLENKEFYGRITRDKYIRAIKNALVGIAVNYIPSNNPSKSGSEKNPSWYKNNLNGNKLLFNDPKYFEIVEDGDDLYIRLNGEYFVDLEYAGLGYNSTIKVQLIFRNEFFRSDDPNSSLNYKYVPPTGDVQLLREIAGQRIKLYRGGILAHPTDYASKDDRSIYRINTSTYGWNTDVSRTKEIAYKHNYTKGFPKYALDGGRLSTAENENSYIEMSDDNSVYDIISIEMDYPHWQELQINNIEISPISSMETDTNVNSLPIPINILDLENFDFLEYNIEKNSYINKNDNIKSIITLSKPNNDKEGNYSNSIDFYKVLIFWYTFRPKVKLTNKFGEGGKTTISIEPYNDWKTRISKENKDYFNKSGIKISESERVIDLEDILNIRCYKNSYQRYELGNLANNYNKDPNSQNLYNIMKYILLNHTIYDVGNSSSYKESFNSNNYRRAKFGGYILDKLLYSDWVFTYRKGDSKRVDDIIRKSANDTALYLFKTWFDVVESIREKYNRESAGYYNDYVSVYNSINSFFDYLLTDAMFIENYDNTTSTKYNILQDYDSTIYHLPEISIPGDKRLIDFYDNNRCYLKYSYKKGSYVNNDLTKYNVWDKRIYKGDNRKLDKMNTKAKLRRGFRMGDKTPDNPFMGFSMPATTSPELVPEHIHLVYCDIYWKDFDKTQSMLTRSEPNVEFTVNPDKSVVRDDSNSLTYDFSGFMEKYNLNVWLSKGKQVIFRILVDEPTNERHKDCPEYITGEYYDNKYGKGFSPNFKNVIVQAHYKCAILALRRWINVHFSVLNGILYTVELPLGISGTGNMVTGGNITPITEIKNIYQSIYSDFNINNTRIIGNELTGCKLVFSSSVEMNTGEMAKPYGWSCNNLGNRDIFEEWMKYNMYGTDSTMRDTIEGGSKHGGNPNSDFHRAEYNKFKSSDNMIHNGFSGVIRSDLDMDELMKPENFVELLYEMKTITPMYVIGYVDKEKYPEQYETLMNEMGYKYTITSAVIEDGYLKVYYSNEGKNGIKALSVISGLSVNLKYKNKLRGINFGTNVHSISRTLSNQSLGRITGTNKDISYTKINTGEVLMFSTNSPTSKSVSRAYITGKESITTNAVEKAYGKYMTDDVYLELLLSNEFNGYTTIPIKLANVNRDTEINLTDSGLLHMFISNYNEDGSSLGEWFDTMYMNHIKVEDNGWI